VETDRSVVIKTLAASAVRLVPNRAVTSTIPDPDFLGLLLIDTGASAGWPTLPMVVRSGVIPKCSCAQPLAMRKPVMTSSKHSRAPSWVVRSRRPCRAADQTHKASAEQPKVCHTTEGSN
jgi:hypothetical protein